MKFSSYRHYTQVVTTRLLFPHMTKNLNEIINNPCFKDFFTVWNENRDFLRVALLPIQEVLMRQAAHSHITALKEYAPEPKPHPEITGLLFEQFISISKIWHLMVKEKLSAMQLKIDGTKMIMVPPSCFDRPSHKCDDISTCHESILWNYYGFEDFKSPFQKRVVSHLLSDRPERFLAIGPTGSGKTLLMSFPVIHSLIHEGCIPGITIIVTPLLSLKYSIMKSFASIHLVQPVVVAWDDILANPQLNHQLLNKQCVTSVMFVILTPEATQGEKFRRFFRTLVELERIYQVVIDEAHHLITSKFRSAFSDMKWMFDYETRLLLLSASLSSEMQPLLNLSKLDCIRFPTIVRKEISFGVLNVKTENSVPFLAAAIQTLPKKSVVIIFVILIDRASPLKEILLKYLQETEIKVFHSQLDIETKEKTMSWFFSKPNYTKILISTTAFSEGVDHPSVSMVLHETGCYSLVDLSQAAGRAARSPQIPQGRHLVLYDRALFSSMINKHQKPKEMIQIQNYCETKSCRLSVLAEFFDDEEETCTSLGLSEYCDVCDQGHWSHGLKPIQLENSKLKLVTNESKSRKQITPSFSAPEGSPKPKQQQKSDNKEPPSPKTVSKRISPSSPAEKPERLLATSVKPKSKEPASPKPVFVEPVVRRIIPAPNPQVDYLVRWNEFQKLHMSATTKSCFLCSSEGHNLYSNPDLCLRIKDQCGRCGMNGHIRSSCPEKAYDSNGNCCYKCFLPKGHLFQRKSLLCSVSFKQILLYGVHRLGMFGGTYPKFWKLWTTKTDAQRFEMFFTVVDKLL